MTITLPKEQQAWLEKQVEDGTLISVEDGVQHAIADLMAIKDDDFSWAQPYVDAARNDVANGNLIDGQTVIDRLRTRGTN